MDEALKTRMDAFEKEQTRQGEVLDNCYKALTGDPMKGVPGLVQNQQQLMEDYYGKDDRHKGTKDIVDDLRWWKTKVVTVFMVVGVAAVWLKDLVAAWIARGDHK